MIIASPVAWYFSNQWLQNFAYKTNLTWWVFLIAGASAILIALVVTISNLNTSFVCWDAAASHLATNKFITRQIDIKKITSGRE